ncbi:MAG: ABC transporter transmembrane domain-containing protein [Acidimicrobiia bacterium]
MDAVDRRLSWVLLRRLALVERWALTGSTLAAVAWLGFGMAVPVVLGWTVQHGVVESDRRAIWVGALLVVLVGVGESACDAIRHWLEVGCQERTRARLRHAAAAAALDLDEPSRDAWPAGQATARATSDADGVAGAVESFGYTIAYLLAIPVVIVLLLRVDVVIAFAVVASVLLSVVVSWRVSALWEHRTAASQAAAGDTIAAAQAALEGFKVVAGIGAQAAIHEAYAARSALARDRAVATARWSLRYGPVLTALSGLSTVAVIWVGGWRAIGGHAEIGSVVTAIGLALFLRAPIGAAGDLVLLLRSTLASARRIVALVHPMASELARGAPEEMARPTPPDRPVGELVVDGVTYRYPGDGRFSLGPVSFRAGPGDVVLLEGPVGSGKSTLAALVAGDRVPVGGTVSLGGRDVTGLDRDARRAAVLRLGPEPFLLATSIATNVCLGAPDVDDAAVAAALLAVGATEFVDRLPEGAATVLADRGASLSGGQRQRLALARALLAKPPVLVLDGALGGLEPDRELVVLASVVAHCPGSIVLLVTPNPGARRLVRATVTLAAPGWHAGAHR